MKDHKSNAGGVDKIRVTMQRPEDWNKTKSNWEKNTFKPITKMEYLIRKIRRKWRRLRFKLDCLTDEEKAFILFVSITSIAITLGIILGIFFPEF